MKSYLFRLVVLSGTLLAGNAYATEETEALRAQIKALEARLAAIEAREQASVSPPPPADAKPSAQVDYGKKGLTITSPDKQFQLRMRAYAQVDNRTFLESNPSGNPDQFLIRSARPIWDAQWGEDFRAKLMLDFAGGQTRLLDAYADYHADDWLNIRLGKFKTPLGIERLQSEQDLLFVERGTTTDLLPLRDIGLQLHGDLLPELEYEVSFVNGSPDLNDTNGGGADDKELAARLFAHPFKESGVAVARGLGIGVAGSYGNKRGSASNTSLTSGYVTVGQARFFSYTPASGTVFADGYHWRVNPQAIYYYGPFGMLSEYVLEGQELRNGAARDNFHNDAFMVLGSYVVSGEDASYGGVVPKNDFDPSRGNWGAWELVARYGWLKVDDDLFPGFANASNAAREESEKTIGLNWYLNYNLKFNFDFSHTDFDGGAPGGDREPERVFLSRAQFRF